MADLIDSVASVMSRAERRVEVSAQNIANISTPGYKRVLSFDAALAGGAPESGLAGAGPLGTATDFSSGKQINTGNPNDLTILQNGFFVVRGPDGSLYTRAGQFRRDGDGRLVTAQGYALQGDGGGDVVLKPGAFQVQNDGTVVQSGEAVARIAVVDFADRSAAMNVGAGLYSAPDADITRIDAPAVEQGALEASNVSAGAEMVSIMAALRSAQTGQRLANLYDDLMGRAITAFGQG